MATAYLTEENFKDKWDDARTFMKPLHQPLPEYERIARNRPHPGIDKAYPKNTDGTLAAIIQEFPKRIIQQIPSGKVVVTNSPEQSIIANFVLTSEIIPNATTQADVLQKSWGAVGKALTFGSSYSMTFFGQHNAYFGGDFRLMYIKDVFLEPGKLTFYDCNYVFVRAWYQESDIDNIIDREKAMQKMAKEKPVEQPTQEADGTEDAGQPDVEAKYVPEWDIKALAKIKSHLKSKDTESKSAGEIERETRSEGIEIIHGFQNGVAASFLSYAPDAQVFVRNMPNKDPRGIMPIQALYCDIDFENPLGRGLVERSGGTQNVIDSMLQSYQYMRALSLNPPIIKRGEYNSSTLKYQNGAIWNLGTNPANSAETAKLDTTALNNFQGDYGLFKSQIIAMNNNGDTSVSATVGNPGFSKTSAGVDAQQLKLGISDNYMRKQYEHWMSDVLESDLNLHFANKTGIDELQLDKDTARKLKEIDPALVLDGDIYMIDYDDYTEGLKFEVDASTSDKASTQAQLEALDTYLQRIEGSPLLTSIMQQYPEKLIEINNQFTKLTGVEDQEKLAIDPEAFAQKQQEAQMIAQQQAMMQVAPQSGAQVDPQAMMQAQDPQAGLGEAVPAPQGQIDPQLAQLPDPMADGVINDTDLQGLNEEELQLIQGLQDRQFDNETIAQAIVMLREGVSLEEVVQVLSTVDRSTN